MSGPEFERLAAALSDPERDDGPDLPLDQQCDPGDPGVWAIWSGGPIKAGHDLAAARANHAWQRLRERGLRPERGEGLFPAGAVTDVTPGGDWTDAL